MTMFSIMKKNLLKILVLCIAICSSVCLFAACSGVEFKINFVVDGEIYAIVNTNGAETIKMPDNPVKDDYTFDGWFWDKDTWAKPFTANSLLDTPLSSDMSVYAKWKEDESPMERAEIVSANGFIFDGNNGKISVSNDTDTYSFINQIQVNAKATWVISTDIYGLQTVATKTIPLNIGNNTVYLLVTSGDGNNINLYTMTVRRRPIYTVSFDTDGGTAIADQQIEEGGFATEPTTTRVGYTFAGWNYGFDEPVADNTIINATWVANTDTPYKVEYYLQNLENDYYTLQETENLTGTTDTVVTANIKTYEHFTVISNRIYIYSTEIENILSANIDADGGTVLKVYYERNRYNVNFYTTIGVGFGGGGVSNCKYGYIIPEITAKVSLGYEWQGWYNIDDELITKNVNIPSFSVENDINYVAKCTVKEEMSNFNFSSGINNCSIWGIKDKTVTEIIVPDYVTDIYQGSFSGCSGLQKMIIPFVGNNVKDVNDQYQYPFGIIFGQSSYPNGMATEQCYFGDNIGSTTTTTYYIPNSLKQVTVTGGNILNGAFYNCKGLTNITIGNGVTNIGSSAFYGCYNLDYTESDNGYYLGNVNNPYVVLIKAQSNSITTFSINEKTKFIYSGAFSSCYHLTTITIPDGIISIGDGAFDGCNGLISVSLPNGIKSIGNYAFSNCNNLLSIIIPDNVESIGYWAFYNCNSLTSITIPHSVLSIDNDAFHSCNNLSKVIFSNTSGWQVSIYNDMSHAITISGDDLLDTTTAATYLISDYCGYNWQRA